MCSPQTIIYYLYQQKQSFRIFIDRGQGRSLFQNVYTIEQALLNKASTSLQMVATKVQWKCNVIIVIRFRLQCSTTSIVSLQSFIMDKCKYSKTPRYTTSSSKHSKVTLFELGLKILHEAIRYRVFGLDKLAGKAIFIMFPVARPISKMFELIIIYSADRWRYQEHDENCLSYQFGKPKSPKYDFPTTTHVKIQIHLKSGILEHLDFFATFICMHR